MLCIVANFQCVANYIAYSKVTILCSGGPGGLLLKKMCVEIRQICIEIRKIFEIYQDKNSPVDSLSSPSLLPCLSLPYHVE